MTNHELTKYIRHYIEKDHTNRAMMLTGPWGCWKSYYIREELMLYSKLPAVLYIRVNKFFTGKLALSLDKC